MTLGWYEPDKRDDLDCRYNENKGYVVFSAMGMQMNHDTRIIQKNERIFWPRAKVTFFSSSAFSM